MTQTSAAAEEFPARLKRHGWSSERADWWAANAAAVAGVGGVRPARVTRVDRGECDVVSVDGAERVVSDSQRAQGTTAPATGDWVAVVDDAELGPTIVEVLPRHTAIVRRDPGPVITDQVLVANVDIVAVVHALDQPFSAARLERFLVLAYDSGADPLVILAKADLGDAAATALEVAELTDAPVLATAATTGEGIDELHRLVVDRTLVFIGLSGSGKSTLTNALLGDEIQATTEVRDADARGRHTTTRRELFLVPGGGVLIDTPGVRAVGLWSAWTAVHRVYDDVTEVASGCRFGDCVHDHEPGCAVQAAVDDGTLDPARVARYRDLLAELTELDDQIEESERRRQKGRRRGR